MYDGYGELDVATQEMLELGSRQLQHKCILLGQRAGRIDAFAPATGAAEDVAGPNLAENDLTAVLRFPDDLDAPRRQETEIGGRQPFEKDNLPPLHMARTEMTSNLGEYGRRQGGKEPDGGQKCSALSLTPAGRMVSLHVRSLP